MFLFNTLFTILFVYYVYTVFRIVYWSNTKAFGKQWCFIFFKVVVPQFLYRLVCKTGDLHDKAIVIVFHCLFLSINTILNNLDSSIVEALNDLTQPVEDFVDEAREDGKEQLKEFDENMSEHEWYRKNRIAIFIAAAVALFFALAITQVIIEDFLVT